MQNAIQRNHPQKNRTVRTAAQAMQRLIQLYRLSGGGFLTSVRRNEEIHAYEEIMSRRNTTAIYFDMK